MDVVRNTVICSAFIYALHLATTHEWGVQSNRSGQPSRDVDRVGPVSSNTEPLLPLENAGGVDSVSPAYAPQQSVGGAYYSDGREHRSLDGAKEMFEFATSNTDWRVCDNSPSPENPTKSEGLENVAWCDTPVGAFAAVPGAESDKGDPCGVAAFSGWDTSVAPV